MKDPTAAKLEKHRGVYWLPCSATEHTDGVPLCPNPRVARLVVEVPPISVPDPDATPMQLEESEETRRPKHQQTCGLVVAGWLGRVSTTLHCTHLVLTPISRHLSVFFGSSVFFCHF